MKQRQPSAIAAILAIIFGVLFIALTFAATPLIALLVGMAIGYILELLTGDYVVAAFNAIGMTGVQSGDLPKVFGLLAVVATFIKIGTSNAVSTRNKDKTNGDD